MNTVSQDQALALGEERHWIEKAQQALRQATYAEIKLVECQFSDRRLVLMGAVSSFYQKQLAQSVVLKAVGNDVCVENRLHVIPGTFTFQEFSGESHSQQR